MNQYHAEAAGPESRTTRGKVLSTAPLALILAGAIACVLLFLGGQPTDLVKSEPAPQADRASSRAASAPVYTSRREAPGGRLEPGVIGAEPEPSKVSVIVLRNGRPAPSWPVRVLRAGQYSPSNPWLRTDPTGTVLVDTPGWTGCAVECPGVTPQRLTPLAPGINTARISVDAAAWDGVVEVIDANGQPCVGAHILAGPAAFVTDRTFELGLTGSDGTLAATAVFPQHVISAWHPAQGRSLPHIVEAADTRITLKVYGGSRTINGRVVDGRGRPIPGAVVGFGLSSPIYQFRMSTPLPREARSDAAGNFSLDGCPAEAGPLWCRADGYATYHEFFTGNRFVTLELAEGCEVVVMTPDDDEPMSLLSTRPYRGPEWARQWPVRHEGMIIFRNVAPGPYRLTWGGHDHAIERRSIHVEEFANQLQVEVVPSEGRPLRGQVVSMYGGHVPDLHIRCVIGSSTVCSSRSGENGEFTFASVPIAARLVAMRIEELWSCQLAVTDADDREGTSILRVDTSEADLVIPPALIDGADGLILSRADGVTVHVRRNAILEDVDRISGIPAGMYRAEAFEEERLLRSASLRAR